MLTKKRHNRRRFGKCAGLFAVCGFVFLCGCAGEKDEIWMLSQDESGQIREAGAAGQDISSAQDSTGQKTAPAGVDTAGGQKEETETNGMGTVTAGALNGSEPVRDEGTEKQPAELPKTCVVHICGAVRKPGVYELPEGSRVMDAVDAGGGFVEEADPNACNLAEELVDGCQIYIMTKSESHEAQESARVAGIQPDSVPAGNAAGGKDDAAGQKDTGKVNLNLADAAMLKTLPGIGDSKAAAIISFREEHGGFSSIEDIMKVSGIKQAAFDKIKDKITV